jgi:hypothetical protein
MSELKKCPFCGSEMELDFNRAFHPANDCVIRYLAFNIERWQKAPRPIEDALQARIDELAKETDMYIDWWKLVTNRVYEQVGEIAELKQHIATLEAQLRWIPVSERLPEPSDVFRILGLDYIEPSKRCK